MEVAVTDISLLSGPDGGRAWAEPAATIRADVKARRGLGGVRNPEERSTLCFSSVFHGSGKQRAGNARKYSVTGSRPLCHPSRAWVGRMSLRDVIPAAEQLKNHGFGSQDIPTLNVSVPTMTGISPGSLFSYISPQECGPGQLVWQICFCFIVY